MNYGVRLIFFFQPILAASRKACMGSKQVSFSNPIVPSHNYDSKKSFIVKKLSENCISLVNFLQIKRHKNCETIDRLRNCILNHFDDF